MVQLAAFVDRFYIFIVPVVFIAAALLWASQRRLLLPYMVSAAFIIVVSGTTRAFRIFLISLPTFAVGIMIHLVLAAILSYPIHLLWSRLTLR